MSNREITPIEALRRIANTRYGPRSSRHHQPFRTRDELITLAREACDTAGIEWQQEEKSTEARG